MSSHEIDDRDSSVVYSSSSGNKDWEQLSGSGSEFKSTTSSTHVQGATAKLTFRGTSIQVFGTIGSKSSSTYSIDGSDPDQVHVDSTDVGSKPKFHQLFYESPNLPNGEHVLIVTNMRDDSDQPLVLDSFVVHSPNTPPTTTTFSTSSVHSRSFTTTIPVIPTAQFTTFGEPFADSNPTQTTQTPLDPGVISGPDPIEPIPESSSRASSTSTPRPQPRNSGTSSGSSNTPPKSTTGFPGPSTISSAPVQTPSSDSSAGGHHTSKGSRPVIAGITVGCLIVLSLVVLYIWRVRRGKSKSSVEPYPFESQPQLNNKRDSYGTVLDITRQAPSPQPEPVIRLPKPEIIPSLRHSAAAGKSHNVMAHNPPPESRRVAEMAQIAPRTSMLSTQDTFSQTETVVGGMTVSPTTSSSGARGNSHQRSGSLNSAERGLMARARDVDGLPPYPGIAI